MRIRLKGLPKTIIKNLSKLLNKVKDNLDVNCFNNLYLPFYSRNTKMLWLVPKLTIFCTPS
ncbi:hypothetical protein LM901004_110027 [Listeria monocytogenes]|nr:hypothetical protein LM901004_110027 [Listeria monocytogenes]